MTTIAKGTTLERFSSEDETLTFTPGSGGYIRFDCSAPSGSTRPTGRQIRSATSVAIQAGSTVFAEAVGADATYTGDGGAAAVAAATRFGQKFRAAYASAARRNPHKNLPILNAPPRAPSTAYACKGVIVSAGGKLYQLHTTGTTGAGSLTGTGAGTITDGTCKWYFIGPDKGSTTTPLPGTVATFTAGITAAASGTLSAAVTDGTYLFQFHTGETRIATVTGTTAAAWTGNILSAATTFQYWPISQVVGIAPIVSFNTWSAFAGLTNKVYYDTTGAFFYSGGTPTEVGTNHAYGTGYKFPSAKVNTGGNATSAYNGLNPSQIFSCDEPKIALQGDIPLYNNNATAAEVNGQFLLPGSLAPQATIGGGAIIVDWGSREPRNYRLWQYGNLAFAGIVTSPAGTCAALQNPNRYRICINGSSMVAGSNGGPLCPGYDLPSRLAAELGTDDVYSVAVGSTGWLNNSTTATTYRGRLPDVIGFAPDLHLVYDLTNDGSYTAAQITAEVLLYLNQLYASLPSVRTHLFGCSPANTGPSASVLTREAAVQAAVTAFNNPLVTFGAVSSAVPPLFTGTGDDVTPTGTGNSDVCTAGADKPHPNYNGISLTAQFFAASLVSTVGVI